MTRRIDSQKSKKAGTSQYIRRVGLYLKRLYAQAIKLSGGKVGIRLFDAFAPKNFQDILQGKMTTIGFAEPDICPVQQQCADPIRETPGQCEQHNKVRGDFTIRLFQPALQRLEIHIELLRYRFARISVFLHQHI